MNRLMQRLTRLWQTPGPVLAAALAPPATEFLLPLHRKQIELREFGFIEARRDNPDWTEEQIREAIQRFGHWEYYFEFGHGLTTRINASFNDRTMDFHRYRSTLISETIMQLLGPDAAAASVVDLACHCGQFSFDLAFRGVQAVQGIEYREKNLAQARFLKDYYRFDNVSFTQGDVYQIESCPADVIMCLGLLYHVVRPVDVLELCYRSASRFAVIESICHKEPISAYKVVGDRNVEVAIEGTRSIEFQPTYRGLIDTMRQVGFKTIIEVVGACDTPIELFSDGSRRCLIGFKETQPACLRNLLIEEP